MGASLVGPKRLQANTAAATVITDVTPSTGASNGKSSKGGAFDDSKIRCDLCRALGTGHDGHRREWCYCDPANRMFKRELLEKRIKFAQSRGIDVPQWILDLLNKAPAHKGQLNWHQAMETTL